MYLLDSVALIFLYWVINVRKVSYRKFRHLLLEKNEKVSVSGGGRDRSFIAIQLTYRP